MTLVNILCLYATCWIMQASYYSCWSLLLVVSWSQNMVLKWRCEWQRCWPTHFEACNPETMGKFWRAKRWTTGFVWLISPYQSSLVNKKLQNFQLPNLAAKQKYLSMLLTFLTSKCVPGCIYGYLPKQNLPMLIMSSEVTK